jgi:hypothetical protein
MAGLYYDDAEDVFDRPKDGATYDPSLDEPRLGKQLKAVYEIMLDGQWHTLQDLSNQTGSPEGSISARIRDLRKPKFGGHTVEHERISAGLWHYRLVMENS